jgi:hypothetical protein
MLTVDMDSCRYSVGPVIKPTNSPTWYNMQAFEKIMVTNVDKSQHVIHLGDILQLGIRPPVMVLELRKYNRGPHLYLLVARLHGTRSLEHSDPGVQQQLKKYPWIISTDMVVEEPLRFMEQVEYDTDLLLHIQRWQIYSDAQTRGDSCAIARTLRYVR